MTLSIAGRQWGLSGWAAAYWPLILAAVAGLYLISLYQGQVLGAIVAHTGVSQGLLHELFHDVRHAAGFMCH